MVPFASDLSVYKWKYWSKAMTKKGLALSSLEYKIERKRKEKNKNKNKIRGNGTLFALHNKQVKNGLETEE